MTKNIFILKYIVKMPNFGMAILKSEHVVGKTEHEASLGML
jgi:hypothetical protein